MNEHNKFQSIMIDAFYGELNQPEAKWFASHLETCTDCKIEYSKLVQTLSLIKQNRPAAMSDGKKLDDFWTKIEIKLDEEVSGKPNILKLPAWSYQVAAAVILVVTGLLVGKLVYEKPESQNMTIASNQDSVFQSEEMTESTEEKIKVQPVSLAERTQKYFDKSKVMMMAIANFDVQKDDPFVLNVGYQKRISREMISEAVNLKKDLDQSDQKQLKKLVSDLEVILIQIASLESEKDLPGIELIKSSVDRRAVLMKINIEEMKSGDVKSVRKTTPKKETGI